jgi:hypothetical protein
MRDRRAAQGKPSIKETTKGNQINDDDLNMNCINSAKHANPPHALQARPLPEASLNPQYARLSGQAADPRRLLDLYYRYFV